MFLSQFLLYHLLLKVILVDLLEFHSEADARFSSYGKM
jgi:hypothetical protein